MSLLARALLAPRCYPHAATEVRCLETHISWVFLAGVHAYKVKKPVSLGFLDFGTLEARRRCCDEEVRLNRRTAPGIYLGVVPITGSETSPMVGGEGPAIEYAVHMRRFDEGRLALDLAHAGRLGEAEAEALATMAAGFHASLPPAAEASGHGTPGQVVAPALQNFDQIERLPVADDGRARLVRLRAWTEATAQRLQDAFAARLRDGHVRECHGDLHLGNIAWIDGRPVAFDAIEFNAELRWIDVASDAAFLFMDLCDRGLAPLAWRYLNAYLAQTGDYGVLRVWAFYVVYRAMVRAKVAGLRAADPSLEAPAAARATAEMQEYLSLAARVAGGGRRAVVLMHGLPGSGKSTVARALAMRAGAVVVRSDVERKRLHGLVAAARSQSALDAGIYGAAATAATYARLAAVVEDAIAGGVPVVVDAAFLRRADRDAFRARAARAGAVFRIVACEAAPDELRRRVREREARGADPSEAGLTVLEQTLRSAEPLAADEQVLRLAADASEIPRGSAPAGGGE